jgi:hypothetical protein
MATAVKFEDELTLSQLKKRRLNFEKEGRTRPTSFTILPEGSSIRAKIMTHMVEGKQSIWYVDGTFTTKVDRYVSGAYFSGTDIVSGKKYTKFFVDLDDETLDLLSDSENTDKELLINVVGYLASDGTKRTIAKFDSVYA